MIHTFLKAKHWQLFLTLYGLPFLFIFFYIISDIFTIFNNTSTPFDSSLAIFFKIFPFISIIFVIGFLGWLWTIAVGLQQHIPPAIKMKRTRFNVFISIAFVYTVFFILQQDGIITGQSEGFKLLLSLIPALHIFSMFCVFYALYFVAKTIKTAKLQREVKFSEFSEEFFLLWFYIIGI
ncbi:hypothetical protein [uncultured Kordia sp.]|uniref:hypothetical protein n=1 Tax=uncultured Kordia sp. TaxID=507699 RepID=UPI0026248886|nr:hypothetical protein [uncultured Kordia sp.]